MDTVSIGLDIGSSSVRAAEVEVKDGHRVVRRYGQVGLPSGWVVDGELINVHGVADAIKRLWTECRFSTNKVILGVSGPRVFVRQADMPGVAVEDLRSSIRFNGEELVPLPLDDATFDFSVLGPVVDADKGGGAAHSVLLVAAHRDVLRSHLAAAEAAGLVVAAMDSTALALMRAVPPAAGEEGLEVLVSIGAELTTVAVREAGVPRFIRTLTVGGNKLTSSLADSLHLELTMAERLKRGAVASDIPQLAQARRTMAGDIRDMAEDVRATVDFFASQAEGKSVDRVLITGGGSRTRGLAAAIGGDLPVEIYEIAPFAGLEVSDLGLDPEALEMASATATTAVGLALWPFESPLIRLSVLPDEVLQARHNRRLMKMAAAGLSGLIGLIGVASAARIVQVHQAQATVRSDNRQIAILDSDVASLQAKTAVHGQMLSLGRTDVAALTGDVDWVRIVQQLAFVMPPNLHITTFSANRAVAGSTSAASAATAGQVGTFSVNVTGSGNSDAAADWIDAMARDGDLANTVISGISVTTGPGGGTVSFSSTSTLTSSALSSRSQAAKP